MTNTAIFVATLANAFRDCAMQTGRIIACASLSYLALILSTAIGELLPG